MKRAIDFFRSGAATPVALVASAVIGLFVLTGFVVDPYEISPKTDMRIEPSRLVVTSDNTFTIEIIVESEVSVNVFAGELKFNHDVLKIESIDYNTSIADLWAELPWYSNGNGSLNFAGGTTQRGGFQGVDTLIKVTFKTLKEGQGLISIKDARILLHDGLGTDTAVKDSIDAIIIVENERTNKNNLIVKSDTGTQYEVIKETPSTDLNGDGKQSIADISIFILNITGSDSRYDFNLDGEVNLKDLNILLGTK